MTVRDPVLISTVTAMPGDRLTIRPSICICAAIERDARAVVQLLALRLAGLILRPRIAVAGSVLLPVAHDGVLGDTENLAVQEPIAGEVEGVDLDLGFLSGLHKANIAVRHHGLDLQPAVAWYDDQQGLRGSDHAAHRMDRELLHHAVYRGGQLLKPCLLLGLDQVLGKPVCLLLGLGQLVRQRASILRHRLGARLANCGNRRLGFAQMASSER